LGSTGIVRGQQRSFRDLEGVNWGLSGLTEVVPGFRRGQLGFIRVNRGRSGVVRTQEGLFEVNKSPLGGVQGQHGSYRATEVVQG